MVDETSKRENTIWWVYIIQTAKGPLYTGITTDPQRRFLEHKQVWEGKKSALGARYFRSQEPQALVFLETQGTRAQASVRESQIKALGREQKLALIQKYSESRLGG